MGKGHKALWDASNVLVPGQDAGSISLLMQIQWAVHF